MYAQELQDQIDEDQRKYEEMREQFVIQERKLKIVITELDETRNALESNERARKKQLKKKKINKIISIYLGKQAEVELFDLTDRVNNLSVQNSALSNARKKLEIENEQLVSELDERNIYAKETEERAKQAIRDVIFLIQSKKQFSNCFVIHRLRKCRKT